MMQRKIQLKTREETLQNIILDLSCFHYLSLNRYIILFVVSKLISVIGKRWKIEQRGEEDPRPGLRGINYVAFVPNDPFF